MKQYNRVYSGISTFIVPIVWTLGLIMVTFVILEILLKRNKPIEIPFHNELYPYVEFRPAANATWHSEAPSPSSRTGEYAIAYTNQDGLRIESPDYLLDLHKPEGQIRIAMIGGSTVHIGTSFDVTLAGAMKRILKQRLHHQNIEVINGGIISAISRQEMIFLLTTLVDYQPDFLIVYDGINDTGQMLYYEKRPNFPYNYQVMEKAWREFIFDRRDPLWKLILKRSEVVNRLWPDSFKDESFLEKVPANQLINEPALRRTYAEAHKENWDKIRQICSAYNIKPFFILQPTSLYALFPDGNKFDGQPTELQNNLYANFLVYEEFRKTTQEFSKIHPYIGVLDLSSFLPKNAFWDGAHVYDDVNDIIACKLADFIMEEIIRLSNRTDK